MTSISIRSGGQTGVDRAALDFAVAHGLSYGGWCPRGGWAEDFAVAPGLLARYPGLTETPSDSPEQRTAWNVRDSHATLLLVRGDELEGFPGTMYTKQQAELVFLRPCLVVDLRKPTGLDRAREWLAGTISSLAVAELVLNIAGPRESEVPGIYAEAGAFIEALLNREYGPHNDGSSVLK